MSTKEKREDAKPSTTQSEIAELAMELKSEAQTEPAYPAPPLPDGRRDPDAGMNSIPREGYPVGGAFGAEGEKPVLERSRKVR